MRKKSIFLTSVAALSAALPCAGMAADSALEKGSRLGPTTAIEEIIVTAQKREERLQDVPMAITAFNREGLEKIGFTNFSDLMNKAPALTVAPYPQGGSALVMFMRGIGQTDAVNLSFDPGVGVYLDDVYLARGQALSTDLGDIERVEVLRGPQGTLYGRNTVGGAVKFVTAKPTGKFDFKEVFDAGNFGYLRSLTTVNLPEYNGFSVKLAYMRSGFDGWVSNPGTGGDFGKKDKEGYRAAVRWNASDVVTLDYAYDHGKQDGISDYQQRQYLFPLFPFNFPLQPNRVKQSWRAVNLPQRDNFVSSGHSLTATWNISDLTTLKSISSYRDLSTDLLVDSTEAFNTVSIVAAAVQQHQFSQELLLSGSDPDLNLKYNLGGFYFSESGDQQAINTLVPAGAVLAARQPFVAPTIANLGPYIPSKAENASAGLYTNVTWTPNILDQRASIDLGLRYSSDTRDAVLNLATATAPGHKTYDSLDPSVTLDYRWTDNAHTYAKFARGYRTGGFNLRNTSLSPFAPERLTSYELGLKSTWLENRLSINIAGFVQDYKDIQLTFTRPGSTPLQTITFNAGKSTTKGIETDFILAPIEGLRLSGNISYLDASYIQVVNPFTGVAIAGGYPRPYTPEWAYNFSAEYTLPPTKLGTPSVSVDYSYTDKQLLFSGTTGDFSPSYALVNARLALSDIPMVHSHLTVALWGKNLTNKEYQVYHTFGGVIFGEPRSYGLNLTYKY